MEQTAPKNPWFPEPYVPKLTFADGTNLSGSASASSDETHLWALVNESLSIMEIMNIFSDPNKTSTIHVDYAPYQEDTFTGYTKLTAVQQKANNEFSIRLNKP